MRVEVAHDTVVLHIVYAPGRAAADRQLRPFHLPCPGLRFAPVEREQIVTSSAVITTKVSLHDFRKGLGG